METEQAATLIHRVGARPGVAADTRLHSLHHQLARALLVILIASPIALGSHGATFWTISAAAVGLVGIWYWWRLLRIGAAPRVPLAAFWPECVLFLAFCAVLLAQALPLPLGLDRSIVLPDGTSVTSESLSFAPGDTWLMLMRQAGYAAFWYLFLQISRNARRARTILLVIFAMIVAHAGYSLVNLTQWGDTVLGFPKAAYQGFATGTFVNRNSFATFLACGIAVGTALLLRSLLRKREAAFWQVWTERAGILVGICFVAGALLATGSRMGAVAGAIGAAVVIFGCAVVRPSRVVLIVAGALVLAGVVAVAGYSGSLVDRVLRLAGVSESRWPLYAQIVELIAARPWSGYGGGSFATVFPVFQHAPVDGSFVWNLGHSTYLSLWAELGILAGSLPIIVVAILVARMLVALRGEQTIVPALAALGTVAAFAAHGTVDFSLEIQANTYLFTAMLALGAGAYANYRRLP
jgi:O-antigen ligase